MLKSRLIAFAQGLAQTMHLMVGLPDYRRYVAHVAAHHPARTPMTEAEFVAERTRRRFEGGLGRCC